MLPDHVLSTQPHPAQFRYPRNIPRQPLISYEYGGIALNDASQGLRRRVWKAEYIEGEFIVSAEGVAPVVVLAVNNVDSFDFTFDQNMRVAIAYETAVGGTGTGARFYWFDNTLGGYTTLELGSDAYHPRCALDDNRDYEIGVSDIILAYMRDGSLYFREQRDRYLDEYLLLENAGAGLIQIGMNNVWRFQFQLIAGDSGFSIPEGG